LNLQNKDNLTSYDVLSYIVDNYNIENYLEIGTREGCSAAAVLCAGNKKATNFFRDVTIAGSSFDEKLLKKAEKFKITKPNIEITLCDTWGDQYGGTNRGTPRYVLELLVNRLHCERYNIKIMTGDSKKTVPTLRENYDLIYIDGDHSYDGAMKDLENCKNKFNKYIVFDDIYHKAHKYLFKCINKFLENNRQLKATFVGKNNNGTVIIYK